MKPEEQDLVDKARTLSGVEAGAGPTDAQILRGILGFSQSFDKWYSKVIRAAVPLYRKNIVGRINPFIRRMELDDLDAKTAAQRLVEDYARRNFVTAGGWALESLAIHPSPTLQKSATRGLDAQRVDPETGDYHLYVLKSGLVTRNSDILGMMKKHGGDARQLLNQDIGTGNVFVKYVVLAGKTRPSFKDNVYRPSSAQFWSEAYDLPEEEAVELALAMAAQAGRLITLEATAHIKAMEVLVHSYIAKRDGSGELDWDFVAKRNMQESRTWAAEDKARHAAALADLGATGYVMQAAGADPEATAAAEAIAGMDDETGEDMMLQQDQDSD